VNPGAALPASPSPLPALLRQVSWGHMRHQPLRHAVAVMAVALGVALAFSVHLINESALGEFSAAVRQVNGQPDFELRAQRDGFDEAVLTRVALHPRVALASAAIEIDTQAFAADGSAVPLRVLGLDALVAAPLTPALMPRPADETDRLAILDPGALFLNAAASQRLGNPATLRVRSGSGVASFVVRGSVLSDGPPLAVLDIAGAQSAFGWLGRVSRIDVRLVPGAQRDAVLSELQLPAGMRAAAPDESVQRISNLSRAYRVNLSVLALVALFTGAFLVFSILSLSVSRRLPQLALLGVLGLSARERLALVLAESAFIGLVGSVLGLALGTALAALALRLLAGDLGGTYFPGITPSLQFSAPAAVVYGALGVIVAVAGGWLPARIAQRIAPAQALKGLGGAPVSHRGAAWTGPLLLLVGVALTQAPPIASIPLAAYVAVAFLLLGGIACVPAMLGLMLRWTKTPRNALLLLAMQRARHERSSATIAVAGVVASLALAVALTVMVTSFREAVTQWLDTVLPADLYARASGSGGSDAVFVTAALIEGARALPGVARVEGQRVASIQLDAQRPAVALIARPMDDAARRLPLLGELFDAPAGITAVYASEPLANVYGLRAGQRFELPLPDGRREPVFVRGVWRDYARQHGAVAIDAADYQRLTGDRRINDMALWLAPGADTGTVQAGIRHLAGPDAALEFASAGEIRALSLRIFDRSFAVTYWLQAVAIAIGLVGIAASFSAQVLARQREFGLLAHLGLTRAQVLAVVAGEGAVWSLAGVLLGLVLGIAVSAVLVHVVNPQSFHWTMELRLPWGRLALLCAAMAAAGSVTAWWSGRAAGSKQAALAVKEDW